jgi:hypothetical protein
VLGNAVVAGATLVTTSGVGLQNKYRCIFPRNVLRIHMAHNKNPLFAHRALTWLSLY